MSNESDKIKHSKRLHADENAISRQVKIAKDKGALTEKTMRQPHRLTKHHAMDCGNPGCVMCGNPRKIWGKKTIQEKKFYQERLHRDSDE